MMWECEFDEAGIVQQDHDTYIDPDIKLYVKGKIVREDGNDLEATDFNAGTYNLLSLFNVEPIPTA
jgi:hypothetical protein